MRSVSTTASLQGDPARASLIVLPAMAFQSRRSLPIIYPCLRVVVLRQARMVNRSSASLSLLGGKIGILSQSY